MKNIKIIKFDEYRYRIQTHNDGIYDMSEPMELSAINEILETQIWNNSELFLDCLKMYRKAKEQGYKNTMILMQWMLINKREHDNCKDEYIKLNCTVPSAALGYGERLPFNFGGYENFIKQEVK